MNAVRMDIGRRGEELLLEGVCFKPGTARLVEKQKVIGHRFTRASQIFRGSGSAGIPAGELLVGKRRQGCRRSRRSRAGQRPKNLRCAPASRAEAFAAR